MPSRHLRAAYRYLLRASSDIADLGKNHILRACPIGPRTNYTAQESELKPKRFTWFREDGPKRAIPDKGWTLPDIETAANGLWLALLRRDADLAMSN